MRRLTNRITNALKQYFPQALDWFQDMWTRSQFYLSVANTGLAFLEDVATPGHWLRPFINANMVVREAWMRFKLGVPTNCDLTYDELQVEYEKFVEVLLLGEKAPLEALRRWGTQL